MAPHPEPSLLRFVLARLEDEQHLVIRNTPMPTTVAEHGDPTFRELFLERRALFERARRDRDVVLACAHAMAEAQDSLLIETPDDPVTVLGSQIIKLVASRYQAHPEYDPAWRPE